MEAPKEVVKNFVEMDEIEIHVFRTLRRAKRALDLETILDLTGIKKKPLTAILDRFEKNGMLYSPEKKTYGLQGIYNGIPLLRYEWETMKELEAIVCKPIPHVPKVDLNFGFHAENFHVLEIGLFKCQIQSLPDSIGNLKSCRVIDLGYNQLKELPKGMRDLTNIERLNLMWNQFSEIPRMMKRIVSCTELEFQGNKLNELPDWIDSLTFMKKMDFGHNQLSTINPKLFLNVQLEDLDFWNNNLSVIPSDVAKLTRLRRLSFTRNKIEVIPDEIGDLISLLKLLLDENKISHLPQSIQKLTQLVSLDLSYNPISSQSGQIDDWAEKLRDSKILRMDTK